MSKLLNIFKFGARALKPEEKGFGALNPEGFFSPTEKVLDIMQQQKGTPEQMFSQMKKIGGKPVKEEMLFTGVEDAFATTPKVTKEELLDYLSDNKTEIDQIVKSEKKMKEAGQGDYEFYRIDFNEMGTTSIFDVPTRYEDLKNKPEVLPLTENITEELSAISFDKLNPDNVKFMGGKDNIRPELIQYRFQEGKDTYDVRGNDYYGYEIYENDKLFVPDGQNSLFPSLNESGLIVNSLREDKYKKANPIQQSKFDLEPRHESYTLPGGDNYQEIVLSMPNLPDKFSANLGKLQDTKDQLRVDRIEESVLPKSKRKIKSVMYKNREIEFDEKMIQDLEDGKVVGGGVEKFQMNPETKEIMLVKPEYVQSTHFYEPNVITWLRTKDRVDSDGKKILYVEEIQSDLSQRGRGQFIMGEKEKKNFINTKNPVIYGDILDNFDKLKKLTNIDEFKGLRKTIMPRADDARFTALGRTFVGHKDATISDMQFDENDLKNSKYSLEDLIKKQMTKYKYLTLKPKQLQSLVNQGISKDNVVQYREIISDVNIDKLLKNNFYVYKPDVQAGYEKNLIGYEDKLYTNVDDYVEPQYIAEQITTLKAGVFFDILRDKLLTMKTKNKSLIDIQERHKQSVTRGDADSFEIKSGRNAELKDLLRQTKEDIFTPDEIKDIMKSYYSKERFKRFEDDALDNFLDLHSLTKEEYLDNVEIETPSNKLESIKAQDKFKTFEAMYFNSEFDRILNKADEFDVDDLKNFDYSSNAKQEVFDELKNLNTNLSKATQYNTRINPLKTEFPSAPFVGSTERFTELAIKNALTYASKNGYDGVAFSNGTIHQKRWNSPELKDYYDKTIPKVLNDLFKQTGVEVENATIFTDKKFKKEFDEGTLALKDTMPYAYDINYILKNNIGEPQVGGFIKDTPTIYLKKENVDTNAKKYIDSGVSLYTPIVGTGLTGVVTSKLLGSEEDIVKDEVL